MANGGIVGPANVPSAFDASGVWSLEEQFEARSVYRWPRTSVQIAVAHLVGPNVSAYPWQPGFGTKYANPPTAIPSLGEDVAFTPNGADIAVAHDSSPNVSAYPWQPGFGTKYANPPTAIPGARGYGVAFTPNGADIAVAHFNFPNVSAYPWQPGFGTKYANPPTAIPNNGYGVAFTLN